MNQGLAWSATVIMKIDLVGPRRRGLAMGLNEFAGYRALAGAALASGFVATAYGLRAGPAYMELAIALAGLGLSVVFLRETRQHAVHEQRSTADASLKRPSVHQLLRRSLWSDPRLFSVSQAGLVNNLNDGLAWGVGGMVLQGVALVAIAQTRGLAAWSGALVALGVGTAMVYPTLLAAVGDIARPSWRGAATGVYRLWRDLGYVAGALLAGVMADAFGVSPESQP